MLSLADIFVLLLLSSLAAWWWRGRGIGECALHYARQHCQRLDIELLDGNVALQGLSWQRDSQGRWRLARRYAFEFTVTGEHVAPGGGGQKLAPYVVPNPYLGSATFEPERFAVSGRGERRIEFRGIPAGGTIRIFNLIGELVQTLHHDGSTEGMVAWDLRTKDLLDVAPGLYIVHVDGGAAGTATGKFAIVK